jgi:hypothetical protein
MGSRNVHFTDGTIQSRKFKGRDRGRQYQYEPCTSEYPVMGVDPYTLSTGATGSAGRVMFPGGSVEMFYLGAGQTKLGPVMTANGLSVALDLVNTEGVEYIFSDYTAVQGERHDHVVATSPPQFGQISFGITTVAGSAEIAFGLRKVEAGQATFANYDELTCLIVNAGDIERYNILNGTPVAAVDTLVNWADGEIHTLKYEIGKAQGPNSAAGFVELFIDGTPTGVSPFTFDDGEVVQPFFRALQNATTTEIYWQWFEIGQIRDVERGV